MTWCRRLSCARIGPSTTFSKEPTHSAAVLAQILSAAARGANRVYESSSSGPLELKPSGTAALVDASGRRWRITEEGLIEESGEARRFPRVPAQRAFWFGWVAQFPDTILIK